MQPGGSVAFPRRGEVWLVRFDPAVGAEIKKTRPALVLQNNLGNRFSDITIVAAISSKTPQRPFPVQVLEIFFQSLAYAFGDFTGARCHAANSSS